MLAACAGLLVLELFMGVFSDEGRGNQMRHWYNGGLIAVISVMVTTCMLGPDYQRPEVPAKADWTHKFKEEHTPDQIIRADWWAYFKDPYLDQLVAAAVAESYDLKILQARIQEAGAGIKSSRADLAPSAALDAGANFNRRVPEGFSSAQDTESYSANVGVSWELDLWGKNRRGYLAGKASFKASQADYKAGYLKLVADIANLYFQIREIDESTSLRDRFYLDSQKKLSIYANQYKEGLVPDWKVARQRAEVNDLKQGLLELDRVRKTSENRLATLLGTPAGELRVPNANLRDCVNIVPVPVGLPSELLTRRPDIIAAEYRLLEATHNIGKAQAARFPSLSLTANGGLASTALSTLLNQWSLGVAPKLFAPLFDAGKRKADLKASEARADIAANEYIKAVMNAFEEVENALVNIDNRSKQKTVIEERVRNLTNVRYQTQAKFQAGLISQLEIIDVENSLLAAENSFLEIHRLLLDDTVVLYKSLGGGWPEEAVP